MQEGDPCAFAAIKKFFLFFFRKGNLNFHAPTPLFLVWLEKKGEGMKIKIFRLIDLDKSLEIEKYFIFKEKNSTDF